MASFLGRCRDLYEAELHGHTSLPLLKMKVGCKPVSLPGGDLGTQVYFLYALPGHAQRPEATADGEGQRSLQVSQGWCLGLDSPSRRCDPSGFAEATGR